MMGLPSGALHPATADAGPRADMTLTLGGDYLGAGKPLADPDAVPDDIPQSHADKKACVG